MQILNVCKRFIRSSASEKSMYFSFLHNCIRTYFLYSFRLLKLGRYSVVIKPIAFTPRYVAIGNRVSLGHHCRIEGISSFSGNSFSPKIVFGDGVSFQQRCHIIAASELFIGANTIASFDVMITDNDHEYEKIGVPVGNQPLTVKKTSIGENCFIGAGVKIQAGTKLGKQCIVGANSVVRGDFPDYCVVVGAPANGAVVIGCMVEMATADGGLLTDLVIGRAGVAGEVAPPAKDG